MATLFTRYAVTDSRDDEAILSYRKAIMDGISIEDAKTAVKKGIWSGERPNEPATRQETAAMILRATEGKE